MSRPAREPLDFHFDFISPYGYFASLRIDALAARHGREVRWHPMLLGVSVMKVMGLKPLLETPLKGDYVAHDVRRHALMDGIRIGRAPRTPMMNPLPAGRAFAWCLVHEAQRAKAFAQAVFDGYWVQACDYSTPASLAQPAQMAGIDPGRLVDAAQTDEASALLRAQVDAALARGIFGSPTVVVDGELFWGYDRLADVERWLSGNFGARAQAE